MSGDCSQTRVRGSAPVFTSVFCSTAAEIRSPYNDDADMRSQYLWFLFHKSRISNQHEHYIVMTHRTPLVKLCRQTRAQVRGFYLFFSLPAVHVYIHFINWNCGICINSSNPVTLLGNIYFVGITQENTCIKDDCIWFDPWVWSSFRG
jgi:hypothetical protein